MNNNKLYSLVTEAYKFNDNWSLIGHKDYLDYINLNIVTENDIDTLITYVEQNPHRKEFKWPIQIGSVQFLVCIFPKERHVRVSSKQLNYELNLIHFDEENQDKNFLEMKEHALAMAEVPLENSPTVIEFISHKHSLPLFNEGRFEEIHMASDKLSAQLIKKVGMYRQSYFEKLSDFALDLTANFMLIRIHMLKFLAILPNLDHDRDGDEVKRIFLETLRRLIDDSETAYRKQLKGQKQALPSFYVFLCKVALRVSSVISPGILAKIIRFKVVVMAKRFIAGENINKATESLSGLIAGGRDATIDQLGELVVSNKEADEYTDKVIEIIEGLNQNIVIGEKNKAGINRAHVSIKISALCNDFKPQDLQYTYRTVEPRLKRILLKGVEHNVFVNIDAEHYHYRDIIFKIYSKTLLDNSEFKDYSQTGIVVQAYLRDGYEHFCDVVKLAEKRGIRMPIRLVKGAYWDAETIEAEAHNFLAPQFLNKEETDIHFRQIIFKALEQNKFIQLAVASHNIQDHCFAEALREKSFNNAPVIEHQCLHMTYEALSVGLSKMNWPTRNYIPVGNLLVGMAYLVRRIMENSSQVGVLTIMRSHKKGAKVKIPTQVLKIKKKKKLIDYDTAISTMTREFKNVYPIKTYLDKEFTRVATQVSKDFEMLKNGNMYYPNGTKEIKCSSDPKIILGKINYDTPEIVNSKIELLFKGFEKGHWSEKNNHHRFSILSKLADLLLFHREELTSLIMFEAGKTIDEAIADVDEAIDFVNFYTREQIELQKNYNYGARGVVGVIAPWNFPLAIACGMTVAALSAGNTVILKPAEQTPLIALRLLELCRLAGITEDLLQISLGEAEVGKSIVEHELIVGVVFTGSKQVGESIYKKISQEMTSKQYSYSPIPKFAITEMGGKNAILVTNNSELDETVSGIIYSAFSHSGQKCSAASRIIIDKELKDNFIKRFSEAVKDIKVGKATDYSTVINPLITEEDQLRVRKMAIEARSEVERLGGRVIVDESQNNYPGYCVGPSVFELSAKIVLNNPTIASKEVFGPLIHIIPYDHIDEGIEIFNSTEYALTGGIFCQSQDDLDYIVPKLEAGNIYINRPNTGARVAIEPFGGFKMSGTGPKAGGKDYITTFNRQLDNIAGENETSSKDFEERPLDELAWSSKLSQDHRIENTDKFVKNLTDQFETFFGDISEINKNKLVEFSDSLNEKFFNISEQQYPNRYIPGQLSFTQNSLNIGTGIIIENSTLLNFDCVMQLLVNMVIGNGISILTTNIDAYKNWKDIIDMAYTHGFSSFNLNVSLINEKSLIDLLKTEAFGFVIFSNVNAKSEFKSAIFNKEFKEEMIKVYYSGSDADWKQNLGHFTHCRSFAINTMRHGAPLELEL
jgi:RHH-type proline utilization regulon transcriptional repressor/proline dehydrogenase/delta 1-pyrroline-5-carboxylate dehydrogenase